MEKKHTISVLVENEFGVLARVAGLFSQKGYNISSLSVSETEDPTLSRMTIVTSGTDQVLSQVLKQLNKLVNVIRAEDLTKERHLTRELFLVKMSRDGKTKSEIDEVAQSVEGRVVYEDPGSYIVEVSGEDEADWQRIFQKLKVSGMLEVVRTGLIAIQRGSQVLVTPGEEG